MSSFIIGDAFTLPDDDAQLNNNLVSQIALFFVSGGGSYPQHCYVHDSETAQRVVNALSETLAPAIAVRIEEEHRTLPPPKLTKNQAVFTRGW